MSIKSTISDEIKPNVEKRRYVDTDGEQIPLILIQSAKILKNLTMLEHCVNLIIKLGIKNIILNTFHLENEIIKFVKNSL